MKRKPVLDGKYWAFVDKTANEVDGWPAWLRGSKAPLTAETKPTREARAQGSNKDSVPVNRRKKSSAA